MDTIISAYTPEHFALIEELAWRIVPEFYAPLLEPGTPEYFVKSGLTAAALAAQVERGDKHFIILVEDRAVGCFSLEPEGTMVVLSHFYVLREYRGRGLGQLAMTFIDREVTVMGARRIELLVLRVNSAAVGLYRKNGYAVAAEVLTRLGNGAVLEDYLMRKEVDY
jgi:ribosomal protein S18 acetylase RimI-like enzyme